MGAPSFVSYVQDVLRAEARRSRCPCGRRCARSGSDGRARDRTHPAGLRVQPEQPDRRNARPREVEELLDALPATVLVVLDEAYAEYVHAAHYPDGAALVRAHSNVVVLRTFSKLFGLAGLRIGYMLGPPPVVTAVRRLGHWYDVTMQRTSRRSQA